MSKILLLQGNQAVVEGAIAAGVNFRRLPYHTLYRSC